MASNEPSHEAPQPGIRSENCIHGGDIEQICRRFELDLRHGQNVEIQGILQGWEEPERSRLLCELVGIEIQSRRSAGLPAEPQEFLEQFPHDHLAINEAFLNHREEQTIMLGAQDDHLKTQSNLRHMRFLAEGGLGQVFIAEDEQLRRDAAVKLIREDLTSDVDSCNQFRLEAEVTGRLDHPGIPVVYAIGETSKGRLFYAMQYVRGTRLDKLIRRHHEAFSHNHGSQWFGLRRMRSHSIRKESSMDSASENPRESKSSDASLAPALDLREMLEVFISVCHTIGYAHRRGILHRDIKPSNIIHGKFGETVVIDWGLALPVARQGVFKDVGEQTLAPRSGRSSRHSVGCIGTPAFMSPEQALGNVPLTPASDIFSLGATLYCILTGTPPFQGQSIREVRQRAIDCDFPKPNSVVEHLPAQLESICVKAMRETISDRYRTTQDLITDLRNYLADRPVQAYVDTPYRRLARWTRHNTNAVLGTLLAMLLLVSSIGFIAFSKMVALSDEQRTSQARTTWASQEKSLREKSLVMAADLAARTLANKLDVIYRTLELHAIDKELRSAVTEYNAASLPTVNDDAVDRQQAMLRIQTWIDSVVSKQTPSMQFRSWYVMSADGTFVARAPEFDSQQNRSSSIGRNFAFRDYFHGLGQDLPPTSPANLPLDCPHNSAAIFSTMDGKMTVNFSVPIADENGVRIGAIAVCVECSDFGDLKLQQGDDQHLLLVESRGYPMMNMDWSDRLGRYFAIGAPQWSAGILLHHQSELYEPEFDELPRVNPSTFRLMTSDEQDVDSESVGALGAQLFPEGTYQDPVTPQTSDSTPQTSDRWMAAYCPVRIESRTNPMVGNTGWYVIVQQKMIRSVD